MKRKLPFDTAFIQGCIFFYNPHKGGEESKALRAREENQRRVKKKGTEGKGKKKGKGEGKGKKGKKGRKRKENKSTNEGGKNMRGKEMKKMDKGTNAKELRNIGITLIIHDRRLSGVYIFK